MTSRPSPPDDAVAELLLVLDELVPLLRASGEARWADWMERARLLIQASDFAGVELLLRAYGGMGSFNDLSGDTRARVAPLAERAYQLARRIQRG